MRIIRSVNYLIAIEIIALLILICNMPNVCAGQDDSNIKEVGVEWICNYSKAREAGWPASDLTYADDNAEKFYQWLINIGWSGFHFGNNMAWESDFEKPAVGGSDYVWIDGVDFAYFCGHGTKTFFLFGTNHDADGAFEWRVSWRYEAEWGDQDLEWIVLHACECLYEYQIKSWFEPVFKGLHIIMGFHTAAYDMGYYPEENTGFIFALYLTGQNPYMPLPPQKIADAWKRATKDTQPSSVYGAWLSAKVTINGAVHTYGYEEYLPGFGTVLPDGILIDLVYEKWSCGI